ncbi:hypothetical protein GCM10023339_47150 [Alloalcanivorax gelatiniphagus]
MPGAVAKCPRGTAASRYAAAAPVVPGRPRPRQGRPAGVRVVRIVLFLVPIVLGIYCLIEAISSRDDEVRHLKRVWWILLILFFPFVGSVAWLAAGRPVRAARRAGPHERSATAFPEYDRPGRFAATDPAADEEFLKKVRERAEEQRRKARKKERRQREGDAGEDAGPA